MFSNRVFFRVGIWYSTGLQFPSSGRSFVWNVFMESVDMKSFVQFLTIMGVIFMSILDPLEESLVFPADLPPANYDESKVPEYTLPNPLRMENGLEVRSVEQWKNQRRPELLELFYKHIYGRIPVEVMNDSNLATMIRITEKDPEALNGKATRFQLDFSLVPEGIDMESLDELEYAVNVLVYVPNNMEGPVPAFIGYNFRGNHTLSEDPGVDLPLLWMRKGDAFFRTQAEEGDRGEAQSRWPIEKIIDSGFALITAHYCDVVPDFPGGRKEGIQGFFDEEELTESAAEDWGAITAWAWGLSMICSLGAMEEELNGIDWKRIIVFGHSRLGKTALWAGARDPRFAMVISNNSGCGGAALSRREYGETLYRMNSVFPHWLNAISKRYNTKINECPVDQHELLALIAPRPLYVASAVEDRWADPLGEFLSCLHADPVYEFLGKEGLGNCTEQPPVDRPVGKTIRYHVRNGKHDITEYDWDQYIEFAKEHLVEKK